jgi:glutamate racemase
MGLFATEATVRSGSYLIEAKQFAPDLQIHQQACPLWVPMIENDELDSKALDDVTERYVNALLAKSDKIDSVLLACTHYPLIHRTIRKYLPDHIRIISQGELVALSLREYLQRNTEMDALCTKDGSMRFFTTDDTVRFDEHASLFFGEEISSEHCSL